jgi:hypothetical protein
MAAYAALGDCKCPDDARERHAPRTERPANAFRRGKPPSRHHAARIDQPRETPAAQRTARIVDGEPDAFFGRTRRKKMASDALATATRSIGTIIQPIRHDIVRPATLHAAPPRHVRSFMLGSEANGAGEGLRTLDPNLGKVVLYP